MNEYGLSAKERERERITRRIRINSAKVCSCIGCNDDRHRLAPYCLTHYSRYRRHGSPDGRIPTRKELSILDEIVRNHLEDGLVSDADRRSFKLTWGSAVARLRKSQSMAKGFSTLQGHSGLTQQEKADILIANYQHREQRPLGMAMLRWMSCRLWAELYFEMPKGKTNFQKERTHFLNLFAGQYIIGQAGFEKVSYETVTVGYEKSIFAQTVGEPSNLTPIKEKQARRIKLPVSKSAPIARAIGVQLGDAVGHALGNHWHTDYRLLERATKALGAE